MIGLRGVASRFGEFSLEVDLTVKTGRYLVILGPSGCGKSLLLGTVAGLCRPDAGRVRLRDCDVTDLSPERRKVGFVFQKSSLFPHMTVEGNIGFGLRARGVSRKQRAERVRQVVRLIDIEALFDRPVTALSGGEAQKVAIARALAPRPEVLLLDEPLSLVDHNARLDLQQTLQKLHAELSFTALHVTHNRDEARALGQDLAVMLGGRLVQVGGQSRVLDHPRCSFVAHFLGLDEQSIDDAPHCQRSCLAGTGSCDSPLSPTDDEEG